VVLWRELASNGWILNVFKSLSKLHEFGEVHPSILKKQFVCIPQWCDYLLLGSLKVGTQEPLPFENHHNHSIYISKINMFLCRRIDFKTSTNKTLTLHNFCIWYLNALEKNWALQRAASGAFTFGDGCSLHVPNTLVPVSSAPGFSSRQGFSAFPPVRADSLWLLLRPW